MYKKRTYAKGAYTLQKIFTERKIFRGPHAQYDFSLEKIVLRMRSAENFPFRGKFSEVYMHLKIDINITSTNTMSPFLTQQFGRLNGN